ncbi:MAG: histidine kinase [Bacteroidales bacterium]|nr:histidine kinase [Bacteroidales bacterium]HNW73763.1 histidine kinase [Bacteroidales bacterium]
MSKKNILLLHLFLWLFAAFVNFRDFSMFSDPEKISMYLASTFYMAVPFYLFYFIMVPALLEKKKYSLFFLVSIACLCILTFLGYSALFLIKSIFSGEFHGFYATYSIKMHFSGMTVITIVATFGSLFRVMLNWLNTMNLKEILEKQKAVGELALLKSKINPHFLFNTLNNIDVLIYEDPAKASQSLLKLSEIMRYMSYETASDFVDLSKEINYISNIVSLYTLRISNPDLIRLVVPKKYPDLLVAPMLFIPFVENDFKYATFKGDHAGFMITFRVDGTKINFTSENRYDVLGRSASSNQNGTGIANVKRRLDLIYGKRYTLDIVDKSGLFTVDLTIETHGD